jgi:hypothetical protein
LRPEGPQEEKTRQLSERRKKYMQGGLSDADLDPNPRKVLAFRMTAAMNTVPGALLASPSLFVLGAAMLWSQFLADLIPAALGVLAMIATLVIVLMPLLKTNKGAVARRIVLIPRHGGMRPKLAMLFLLLGTAGVCRVLLPRHSPQLRHLLTEELIFFLKNPHMSEPSWQNACLPTGIAAPDFTLPDPRTGTLVHFSQYRGGRPAVLVLGSATCKLFCDSAGGVRRLYDRYKDRVAFVFVQVTKAPHRLPSSVLRAYETAYVVTPSPNNRDMRARLAADYFGFPFPCLLDTEDKKVEKLYDAWPRRLIVIQPDGRIARDFGRGLANHWDFKAIQACVAEQLDKTPAAKAALHGAAPKDVPSVPR